MFVKIGDHIHVGEHVFILYPMLKPFYSGNNFPSYLKLQCGSFTNISVTEKAYHGTSFKDPLKPLKLNMAYLYCHILEA